MQHRYHRRVHFADTDAAGVVHFSRLLCYAEEAEHELVGVLDIPLLGGGGWPRVHVECSYHAPARVGDELVVTVAVENVGQCSVTWAFSISHRAGEVATGEIKTVYVDAAGKPAELDPEWRGQLLG